MQVTTCLFIASAGKLFAYQPRTARAVVLKSQVEILPMLAPKDPKVYLKVVGHERPSNLCPSRRWATRARGQQLRRHARDMEFLNESNRRSAVLIFGLVLACILYLFTKDERTRSLKICPRPREFVDDYLADPQKRKALAAKLSVRYEAPADQIPEDVLRSYLQDPACVPLQEWWQAVKPF